MRQRVDGKRVRRISHYKHRVRTETTLMSALLMFVAKFCWPWKAHLFKSVGKIGAVIVSTGETTGRSPMKKQQRANMSDQVRRAL